MIYGGDLGVHNSIKVATQVYRVVKKVYGMLAFIGHRIADNRQEVMCRFIELWFGCIWNILYGDYLRISLCLVACDNKVFIHSFR